MRWWGSLGRPLITTIDQAHIENVLPFFSGTHDTSPFNRRWNMVEERSHGRSFLEERDTSGSTFEDQEVPCVYTKCQNIIINSIG